MNLRLAALLAGSLLVWSFPGVASAQSCTSSTTCPSGRTCVDGQCCNTACGGGDPNDCQACSVAAGATINGMCATLPVGRTCRTSIGICDVTDVCSGLTTDCPDVVVPAFPRTICRGIADVCDVEEYCPGTSPTCPPDAYQPMGYRCRDPATPCDMVEYCPGDSIRCNPDLQMGDGTFCTPPAPPPCTTLSRCMGGMCLPAVGCVDIDVCTMDECVGGMCVFTPMTGCDAGGFLMPDSGRRTDAGGTPRDGGLGGMDAGSMGCGGPVCPCPRPASACDTASDCLSGQVCRDGVCGEHTCVNAGADCTMASDCPTGTDCTDGVCVRPGGCTTAADCAGGLRCEPGPSGDLECVGTTCTPETTCPSGTECVAGVCVEPRECVDERDCPLGFGCEPGSGTASICVDRRPPCSSSEECPFGFVCEIPSSRGGGFCRRVVVRCETAATCQTGESCVDVDGDGLLECQGTVGGTGTGACTTNADCMDGEVCGISPTTEETLCGPFGPCDPTATDPCGPGSTAACVALDPGGVPECVLPGGSCDDDTDCEVGQVCATTAPDAPPSCFAGMDPGLFGMDAGRPFDAGPDVVGVSGGGCVCRAGRERDATGALAVAAAALVLGVVRVRRRARSSR